MTREQQLHYSREAKRKRTGTCRVCGAVTRYGGRVGGPAVSEICLPCAAKESGEERRGKGEVQQQAMEFLAEPRRYSEVAAEFGSHTPQLLNRLRRYGLIRRVSRGVYVRVEV